MTTARWILGVLCVVGPGLLSWWTGRRLVRHLGEPAFPERYARHRSITTRLVAIAAVGAFLLPPRFGVWFAILLVPSAILGSFPAHRRIHGETWGPGAYLFHWLRVFLVGLGPWMFALAAPLLFGIFGDALLPGLVWVAIALVWTFFLSQITMRGLGARPVSDPELRARLEAIVQRSQGPAPSLWTGGPTGGRFVNGLAVPGSPPAVLLTRDLLAGLEPAEADAIFAHEMAHVETFGQGSWRMRRFAPALLLALYPVLHQALAFFDFQSFTGLAWMVVWLIVIAGLSAGTRTRETEADLRALALTGNGEVLIRALEKLHAMVHLPRRKALDQEARESHPSLANRVVAIREAAGMATPDPTAAPPMEGPGPGSTADILVGSTDPTRAAILGPSGIAWLRDLDPPPVAVDEALRSAGRIERIPYGDVVELRIEARGSGVPRLLTRDSSGRTQRMELGRQALADVEEALERAEPLLGGAAAAASSPLADRPLLRLAGLVTLLAGLSTGAAWGVTLVALVLIAWPNTFTLVAAGAAVLVRAVLALPVRPGSMGSAPPLLLASIGVLLLVLAWRRHSRQTGPTQPGGRRPAVVLLLGVLCGALIAVLKAPPSSPAMAAHLWVAGGPGTLVILGGLTTAALLAAPRSYRRWGGLGLVALISATWVGTPAFRARTGDALNMPPARLGASDAEWEEVWRTSSAGTAGSLRMAPGGARVAVTVLDGEDWTVSGSTLLWNGGSQFLPGIEVRWSDPTHVAGLDASGGRILRVDVESFDSTFFALPDQEFEAHALRADSLGWRVVTSYASSVGFLGATGAWDRDAPTLVGWPAFGTGDDWGTPVATGGPRGSEVLLYRATFGWAPLSGIGQLFGSPAGTRLWAGDDTGIEELGTSALWIECEAMHSHSAAQCVTPYRAQPEVWTWRRGSGLIPVGTVDTEALYAELAGDGVHLMTTRGPHILVDPASEQAWWLPVHPAGILAMDYRDGFLGMLVNSPRVPSEYGSPAARGEAGPATGGFQVVVYRR